MQAANILKYMIDLLLSYLEELSSVKTIDENDFAYGEKTAYTECLEIVQLWEHARSYGLDFDIEKKYPL